MVGTEWLKREVEKKQKKVLADVEHLSRLKLSIQRSRRLHEQLIDRERFLTGKQEELLAATRRSMSPPVGIANTAEGGSSIFASAGERAVVKNTSSSGISSASMVAKLGASVSSVGASGLPGGAVGGTSMSIPDGEQGVHKSGSSSSLFEEARPGGNGASLQPFGAIDGTVGISRTSHRQREQQSHIPPVEPDLVAVSAVHSTFHARTVVGELHNEIPFELDLLCDVTAAKEESVVLRDEEYAISELRCVVSEGGGRVQESVCLRVLAARGWTQEKLRSAGFEGGTGLVTAASFWGAVDFEDMSCFEDVDGEGAVSKFREEGSVGMCDSERVLILGQCVSPGASWKPRVYDLLVSFKAACTCAADAIHFQLDVRQIEPLVREERPAPKKPPHKVGLASGPQTYRLPARGFRAGTYVLRVRQGITVGEHARVWSPMSQALRVHIDLQGRVTKGVGGDADPTELGMGRKRKLDMSEGSEEDDPRGRVREMI